MKNKLNETGDFGKINSLTQINFNKSSISEDEKLVSTIKWAHPELSRELVLELMGYVSTQEEYAMLQSDLAQLDAILAAYSEQMKGGVPHKMENTIVTIQGEPVIDIYESFDGSYWFITEKLYKQDTVLNGRIYRNDQIFFGYARLSACPEFAEFGNISETELKLAGAWKVPQKNWSICPEVEVVDEQEQSAVGEEVKTSPLFKSSNKCYKEVIL